MSAFSSAHFLKWKYLVDRKDCRRGSAFVPQRADNPTARFVTDDVSALASGADVDRHVASWNHFMPFPTDSSRLSAVLAAQDKHEVVLINRPSAGESQNITNAILQCLAVSKTLVCMAKIELWRFSIFKESSVRKLLQTYPADRATDLPGQNDVHRNNGDINAAAMCDSRETGNQHLIVSARFIKAGRTTGYAVFLGHTKMDSTVQFLAVKRKKAKSVRKFGLPVGHPTS